MEHFNRLPVGITSDILARLPTEWVLDCKLVCKTWRSLIGHQSFSKAHLHQLNNPSSADDDGSGTLLGFITLTKNEQLYYFDYNEINESIQRIRKIHFTPSLVNTRFLGSCNGLICFTRGKSMLVCNPITKEYVLIPEVNNDIGDDSTLTCGFGYVASTNEYKIVVLTLTMEFVQVQIYTLGSGTGWRNLGKCSIPPGGYWAQGIFTNGTLYWMGLDSKMIEIFDMAEEKFREHISPPPLPSVDYWWVNKIGVLNGLLCFASYVEFEGALCYDIWLLKKKKQNHDMKEPKEEHQSMVWSKEFRIDRCHQLVAVMQTGGVLTHNSDHLNIYDPKSSTSKRLMEFKERTHRVFPHKNTLISLKELGEEDTKTMEFVEVEDAMAMISL